MILALKFENVANFVIYAAKTWGSSKNFPILVLHGVLDNAGAFDRLLPLLPFDYYYICVDLPGHGQSSMFPNTGLTLQAADYVYSIKLIVDHLQLSKFSIMGHSFGGAVGVQFAMIYPECIDTLLLIDSLCYHAVQPSEFGQWMKSKLNEIVKQKKKETVTKLSYSQALNVTMTWRFDDRSIDEQAAEVLMKRSVVEDPDGQYRFTRDPRLNAYMWSGIDDRYFEEIIDKSNMSFKMAIIITKESEKKLISTYNNTYKLLLKKTNFHIVEGNHYIHMNNPALVASILNGYLDENSFPF